MHTEKRITGDVRNVGELRAFLIECDEEGVPENTPLHAKTRAAWSPHGARLAQLVAVTSAITPKES